MVTLKDIAKKSNVNISTASRALSGNPLVSEKTRDRIHKVAAELKYRPNLPARSLAGSSSKTIGIIVWGIETNYYVRIIKNIEQYLHQHGYMLIVGIGNNSYEKELHCLESFNSRQVDGIILVGPFSKQFNYDLPKLKALFSRPSVIIQAKNNHDFVNNIDIDDYAGVLAAVKHLAELGHKKIGFISRKISRIQFSDFRKALNACGLPLNKKFVKECLESYEIGGYKAMQEMLTEKAIPTAIFFATDYYAIGAGKAIREHGLSIPNDISLVGFYDIRESSFAVPPLTTIHVPVQQIALMAAQQIVNQISNAESISYVSLTVHPQLILRESSGPPKKRTAI